MIFSGNFLQGQIIGKAVNNSNNSSVLLALYFYKGVFLVTYRIVGESVVFPLIGKEGFLATKNNPALVFTLVNGFKESDIDKLSTLSDCKSALGYQQSVNADNVNFPVSYFDSVTGYVEPQVITSIEDPTLSINLAYAVYLRNILSARGIGYKGLGDFIS